MHTSLHLGTWRIFAWELGKMTLGELAKNGLKKHPMHHAISKII